MKILFLVLVIAIMALCMPVMADEFDNLGELLSDSNDSCPMLLRLEVLKQFDDVMDKADVQVGVGYVSSIKNLTDKNHVELITRVIF